MLKVRPLLDQAFFLPFAWVYSKNQGEMTTEFRVKVLDLGDDDELLYYQIYLSNGWQSTTLEFYAYDDAFVEFGSELVDFPRSIDSKLALQVGKDNSEWAYYLLLEVFCYEPNGASLISVKVKNFGKPPISHSCEFYITSIPAALNRLGRGLKGWNPKNTKEYNWGIDD